MFSIKGACIVSLKSPGMTKWGMKKCFWRAWQMPLNEQVKSQCLHFLGHALRMNQVHPAGHSLEWIPVGGKQWCGQPRRILRATLADDLESRGLMWTGAWSLAANHMKWRQKLLLMPPRGSRTYDDLGSLCLTWNSLCACFKDPDCVMKQ